MKLCVGVKRILKNLRLLVDSLFDNQAVADYSRYVQIVEKSEQPRRQTGRGWPQGQPWRSQDRDND